MFGFGNKKKFRRRVRALLPTVGIDEGDAGILHIYSLIDDWYLKGLNEYETALAFIFTKIENLAQRDDPSEARSLYANARRIQSEWVKNGAVTESVNLQFKSIAASLNLDAMVYAEHSPEKPQTSHEEETVWQPYSEEQFLDDLDSRLEEEGIGISNHNLQSPEEFAEQLYKTVEREGGKVERGEGQSSPRRNSNNQEAAIRKRTTIYFSDCDESDAPEGEQNEEEEVLYKRTTIYSSEQDRGKKHEVEEAHRRMVLEAKKLEEEHEKQASSTWLRGEWEYLQRKRAKGQQLDSYELGLEKKYEELQAGKGKENFQKFEARSDATPQPRTTSKITNEKETLREIARKTPASYSRCPKCNQAVNFDLQEKNLTCPSCKHIWTQDEESVLKATRDREAERKKNEKAGRVWN